jgi:ankyrin repeat protein
MLQAAASGDLQEIRRLIAAGLPVEAHDRQGRTALLLAVETNRVEVATALLDAGASVNAQALNLDSEGKFISDNRAP